MSGSQALGILSAGAGRSIDLTWPDRIVTSIPAAGTNIGTPGGFGRQDGATPVFNTSSQQMSGAGAPTAKWEGGGFGNRAALRLRPGTVAGGVGVYQSIDAMTMNPAYGAAANQADSSTTDDFACYRCFAPLWFNGAQGSYTGDTGLIWCTDIIGARDLQNGGCGGFGFCQTADAVISFVRRQNNAGALTVTPLAISGTLNQWHIYEIRVIGANATTNAKLRVLVDGQQLLNLDWVTDGLTNTAWSGGSFGLVTTIVAHGGGAANGEGVAVNKIRFMAGPTEASLL